MHQQIRVEIDDASSTISVSLPVTAPVEEAFEAFRESRATWFGVDMGVLSIVGTQETFPWRLAEEIVHPALPSGAMHIDIAFTPEGDGTRVTHTCTLDASIASARPLESIAFGMREMLVDFAIYVETGVAVPRHIVQPPTLGIGVVEHSAGALVVQVHSGLCADEAGIRPGDILTHVDRAAIYGNRELWAVLRCHEPGDVVELRWVQDGKLRVASHAVHSIMEELMQLGIASGDGALGDGAIEPSVN
jgi:hypothetical protein